MSTSAHNNARLAVDIGGTFTDLAIEKDGQRWTAKVLTTPAAPEKGVLEGVQQVLAKAAMKPADLALVIHGTTLATNAVIERKGAKTALITTDGFRDVLALANEARYDQYDLNIELAKPLVPRRWRLPVPERLDNTGKVLLALDEAAVRAHIPFMRAEGIESLAIGFIHGFVNPTHERRAAEIVREAWPELPVSLSSEVSPEMREWERFSTTVANAYVQPLMARYLKQLELGLRDAGLACPLYLMLSGGGLTTIDTAARFPIRLVESGPAGGAIFSAFVARQRGFDKVLSFDMGGTTAKVCLIDDFRPQASRTFEVARVGRFKKGSGLPLRIPVIEMVEIGAGGGSIAQVDSMGRIQVGPESAGADPGPACYGRGGTHPAVTDANLALGRYDPELFAGGALRLYPDQSRKALAEHVGGKLALSADMAALGVVEMVDENMANAARVHAIESAKNYEGRVVIAFGGGGPVHGYRVAEKIGVKRILVPSGAGVGSAIGFLRAPVAYEVVKSLYQRFGSFDVAAVNGLLAAMSHEAAGVVAEGAFGAPIEETRIAYMRYVGQGHEIAVPIPPRALTQQDVREIRALYDSEYSRFYDRPVPGSDVEILSFAVTVRTVEAHVEPAAAVANAPAPSPIRVQMVRDTATGEVAEWQVYDRDAMRPGATVAGPAIIAEAETSTLIGPGWICRMDGLGYLDLTQEAAR
ncbi:MAG: hydantoinase/oxoprolinase family protein [Roseomonas sp.]|nr:hydantoinase/oxoprolinase family protein [Roseomonas sp.]MCA3289672.1 hydantoinase/oxoprolinase family protein [Roseomonas sp.]MCA3292661.1 hydantoinase/oxoprolinase family protein [Roseomonas sp.]